MRKNVIIADFSGGARTVRTAMLTQWDYGQVLRVVGLDLPDAFEVHFSKQRDLGTAKVQVGRAGEVWIPDEYLTTPRTLYAWIYLHAGASDGETVCRIEIPVEARSEATADEPTPVQQAAIDVAIAALTDGVTRAEAAADAAEQSAALTTEPLSRVTSLDDTAIAAGNAVAAVGIPIYVDAPAQYAEYGLTASGWYLFIGVAAKDGGTVTEATTVTGAAGAIVEAGADHVALAVRFDTTAQSVPVVIDWAGDGASVDRYVFTASDLAARNLDYRTTFYIYDLAPFAHGHFEPTADATFAARKTYWIETPDGYVRAEVTTGNPVPEATYFERKSLSFYGMTPNVTYKLDEIVDCPIIIDLPEVPVDGHGAWLEMQLRYAGSYSCTINPPSTDVKVGTAQTQAQTAGINTIDLQYTCAGEVKMWTLLNTHSNIPT